MNILYHDLYYLQFEELVIEIGFEILGQEIQGFVTGKDGGRDARFVGKAKEYRSWDGTVIVQAKHTELLNKSFSEPDFFGDGENSILNKEIPRIKRLIHEKELDYYMMFSNRRLTGVTDAKIRKYLSSETGLEIDRIRLFDISEIDRLIKRYPNVLERACLSPGNSPPDIDPSDLADVITSLAEYKTEFDDLMEGSEPPPEKRVTPAQKNESKGLGYDYFENQIQPRMVDFSTIRSFLGHPENQAYVKLYEDTAQELEAKLVAWEDSCTPYERLIEQLIARLFARDYDLRKNKRLTRSLVFYMYCNCDIASDIK